MGYKNEQVLKKILNRDELHVYVQILFTLLQPSKFPLTCSYLTSENYLRASVGLPRREGRVPPADGAEWELFSTWRLARKLGKREERKRRVSRITQSGNPL